MPECRRETPLPERPRPPEPGPAANHRPRRLLTANHTPRPHSPTPLYFILTTIWLDIFPPGHTSPTISPDIDFELRFPNISLFGFVVKTLDEFFIENSSVKGFFVNKMHHIVRRFLKTAS